MIQKSETIKSIMDIKNLEEQILKTTNGTNATKEIYIENNKMKITIFFEFSHYSEENINKKFKSLFSSKNIILELLDEGELRHLQMLTYEKVKKIEKKYEIIFKIDEIDYIQNGEY